MSNLMKSILIIVIVLGIMNLSSAQSLNQFSVINSYFGTNGNQIYPVPGQQDVPFTIVLQNTYNAKYVNASFMLYNFNSGFKPTNGQNSVTESMPIIDPDQQFSITFYVNIPSYAKESTYDLDLQIESNGSFSNEDTILVPFQYGGVPKLHYSLEPSTLIPGKINNVTLNITNDGSANIENLQINLNNNEGISLLNSINEISNLNINSSAYKNLSFYVPDSSASSTADFIATSSILNGYGQPQILNYSFSIPVGSTPILLLNQTDTSAYIDSSTPLSFKLSNIGSSNITNVEVSFDIGDISGASVVNNITEYFPVIKANSSINYTPVISSGPSVSEGGYSGDITVSYENSLGQELSQQFPIGFTISGLSNLVIQNSQTTSIELPSNEIIATLSGTFVDEGSDNAYYTTLYGYLEEGNKIIGSNSTYIGEIQTDSPMPFSISIDPIASKYKGFNSTYQTNTSKFNSTSINSNNQNLKMVIYETYKNGFNQNFTTPKTTLNVSAPVPYNYSEIPSKFIKKNNDNGYIDLIIVIIVIIILFALYRHHKSPKKKFKKSNSPVI